MHESLTKAAQTADLLRRDLNDIYKDAPAALAMLVWDMLEAVAKMEQRLNNLVQSEGGTK